MSMPSQGALNSQPADHGQRRHRAPNVKPDNSEQYEGSPKMQYRSMYAETVFGHKKAHMIFGFVEKIIAQNITKYPLLCRQFGQSTDKWALTYMHLENKSAQVTALSDDMSGDLNPSIISILLKGKNNAAVERNLAGDVLQWLCNVFDQTEYGRTRHVLESAMRVDKQKRFDKIPETTLWYLVDGPSMTSPATKSVLWPIAAQQSRKIPWPPDEAYDDFRNGKRKYRPKLARGPVQTWLYVVLDKAQGAVEINTLTTLFISCHPYMDIDFDTNDFTLENLDMSLLGTRSNVEERYYGLDEADDQASEYDGYPNDQDFASDPEYTDSDQFLDDDLDDDLDAGAFADYTSYTDTDYYNGGEWQ